MLRFALSAMALAGILATTFPAFADAPTAAAASDHSQAAAATTAPPAPAAPGRSSGAPEPDDFIPVGLGWG
jgi:hypothetical protein